jgi:uncharacterized protein YjbJ (UPF0337 family)
MFPPLEPSLLNRNTRQQPSVGQVWLMTERPMDRQRIKGGVKKGTGAIKEKAGKALGDRHLEAKGKAEKAEGHIRSGVGKAKDAVREAAGKQ